MTLALRPSADATATWACPWASVVTNAICLPSRDQTAPCSSQTVPGQAVIRTAPVPSLALAIQSADASSSASPRFAVTTLPYTRCLPSGEIATSLAGCTEFSACSTCGMDGGCAAAGPAGDKKSSKVEAPQAEKIEYLFMGDFMLFLIWSRFLSF